MKVFRVEISFGTFREINTGLTITPHVQPSQLSILLLYIIFRIGIDMRHDNYVRLDNNHRKLIGKLVVEAMPKLLPIYRK